MKTIIILVLLFLCATTTVFAAQVDAARVEGDLKIGGLHFSKDGSTMDTANGLLKDKSAWVPGNPYSAGDVVQYLGSSYVCKTANVDTVLPSANWSVMAAQGSSGLKNRGAWSSTALYNVDDVVQSGGSSYVSTSINMNQVPPNASFWAVLASQGIKGDNGIPGPAWGGTGSVYRWKVFDTFAITGWALGNDATLFGGVNPSSWSNSNYTASTMNPTRDSFQALFTNRGYAGKNALIVSESYAQEYAMGSSSDSRFVAVLFRIKNNTGSAINWTPTFNFTGFAAYNNYSSLSVNGANNWLYSGNADPSGATSASVTLSIPASRTSSVVFIVSSTYYTYMYNFSVCSLMFGFRNNSLLLPAGLEYVDDLDTGNASDNMWTM